MKRNPKNKKRVILHLGRMWGNRGSGLSWLYGPAPAINPKTSESIVTQPTVCVTDHSQTYRTSYKSHRLVGLHTNTAYVRPAGRTFHNCSPTNRSMGYDIFPIFDLTSQLSLLSNSTPSLPCSVYQHSAPGVIESLGNLVLCHLASVWQNQLSPAFLFSTSQSQSMRSSMTWLCCCDPQTFQLLPARGTKKSVYCTRNF